jgi:nitrate reductase gamma subunit
MDAMIAFARGPLFALTFGIMILGLLRLIVIQVYTLMRGKGRRLRQAPWRRILGESITWAVPLPHLIRGTILFSSASFLLHVGLILVPIFLAEHVVLWEGLLGAALPAIGAGLADVLTVMTLVCLAVLLGCRTLVPRQRAVSQPMDYLLLLAIMLPFASGLMASHPALNPFPWSGVMLVHLLSAELLFLLVPTTKLAHVVLYAFDRISAVHWQLRPGAGDRVAEALFGSEARV